MRAQPLEVLRTYMKRNFTLDLDNAASQRLWDECQKAEDENAKLAKALRHCKGLFEDIQTEEDLQLVCGLCGNGLTHIDMILKPKAQISGGTPYAESDCSACSGGGWVYGLTNSYPITEAQEEPEVLQCPKCNGTGKKPNRG